MSAPAGVGGSMQQSSYQTVAGIRTHAATPTYTRIEGSPPSHTRATIPNGSSPTFEERAALLMSKEMITASSEVTSLMPASLRPRVATSLDGVPGSTQSVPSTWGVLGRVGPLDPSGQVIVYPTVIEHTLGAQFPIPTLQRSDGPVTRDTLQTNVENRQNDAARARTALEQAYPEAVDFAPARDPGWDPLTFTPRTKHEAKTFSLHLTSNVAIAVADVHALEAELALARYDAEQSGSAEHLNRVAVLEHRLREKRSELASAIAIVNQVTDGAFASEDVQSAVYAASPIRATDDDIQAVKSILASTPPAIGEALSPTAMETVSETVATLTEQATQGDVRGFDAVNFAAALRVFGAITERHQERMDELEKQHIEELDRIKERADELRDEKREAEVRAEIRRAELARLFVEWSQPL